MEKYIKSFKTAKGKKKAFTLVELLIVMAVIAILFVVYISKVGFATDKAKETGVKTDFRSYELAAETVFRENGKLAIAGDTPTTDETKAVAVNLNSNLDLALQMTDAMVIGAKDPWGHVYTAKCGVATSTDVTAKTIDKVLITDDGTATGTAIFAADDTYIEFVSAGPDGIVADVAGTPTVDESADNYKIIVAYTSTGIHTVTSGFSKNINN